jgi:hypothetical protein
MPGRFLARDNMRNRALGIIFLLLNALGVNLCAQSYCIHGSVRDPINGGSFTINEEFIDKSHCEAKRNQAISNGLKDVPPCILCDGQKDTATANPFDRFLKIAESKRKEEEEMKKRIDLQSKNIEDSLRVLNERQKKLSQPDNELEISIQKFLDSLDNAGQESGVLLYKRVYQNDSDSTKVYDSGVLDYKRSQWSPDGDNDGITDDKDSCKKTPPQTLVDECGCDCKYYSDKLKKYAHSHLKEWIGKTEMLLDQSASDWEIASSEANELLEAEVDLFKDAMILLTHEKAFKQAKDGVDAIRVLWNTYQEYRMNKKNGKQLIDQFRSVAGIADAGRSYIINNGLGQKVFEVALRTGVKKLTGMELAGELMEISVKFMVVAWHLSDEFTDLYDRTKETMRIQENLRLLKEAYQPQEELEKKVNRLCN